MSDPTTICPQCGAEHDTPELLEAQARIAELVQQANDDAGWQERLVSEQETNQGLRQRVDELEQQLETERNTTEFFATRPGPAFSDEQVRKALDAWYSYPTGDGNLPAMRAALEAAIPPMDSPALKCWGCAGTGVIGDGDMPCGVCGGSGKDTPSPAVTGEQIETIIKASIDWAAGWNGDGQIVGNKMDYIRAQLAALQQEGK